MKPCHYTGFYNRTNVIFLRGIKRLRGEEFTRLRGRACARVIQLQNPPKDARFFNESVDIHAIKTAQKVSCIF